MTEGDGRMDATWSCLFGCTHADAGAAGAAGAAIAAAVAVAVVAVVILPAGIEVAPVISGGCH